MKKLVSIILCFIMCLALTSCSNKSYSLNIEIAEMPKNIDPQLAKTEAELMIVRNTFEGLMRYDGSGKLSLGAAESYAMSNDKKEYSFKLRKNLSWSDDTELTAYDYQFAIKRAVLPQTNSPFSDILRNIYGATDVLSRNGSAENIGVSTPDKHTIVFKLNRPDEQFLEKLTLSVFMPCNEEFFTNCKGKYGLDKNNIISNSNYYVSVWNKDNNSIRITSSNTYNGIYKTGPQFIWLNVSSEEQKNNKTKRLANETIDLTSLNYTEASRIEQDKVNLHNIYNSTYSILFNHNTVVGSNSGLIKALSNATNKDNIKKLLPKNFKTTNSIVPPICKVGNTSAEKVFTHKNNIVSIKAARKQFLNSLQDFENSSFPSFSILCEDDPTIKSILNSVVSYWQENLGAYIRIEVLPKDDLLLRVQESDYTAAFVPITAKSDSAFDFLSSFKNGYSQNIINFKSNEFDNLLQEKNKSSIQSLKKAESILLSKGNIIPICDAPTIYGSSKKVDNIIFSLFNGITDFTFITK